MYEVNPCGARRGQSLLISAPNLDPLLQLGRVSFQSPRGPLGWHACMHTANSDWQQYYSDWQQYYYYQTYLELSNDNDPSSGDQVKYDLSCLHTAIVYMWFLALPSLHPSTFFENVFKTCVVVFANVVLANVFQVLANKSVNTTVFCYISRAGSRTPSKIKSHTRLTSLLHVYKHLTHTGRSIKRLATCCYPSIA